MIIPLLVEHRGFEPLTPTLPVWCAPSCANAPKSYIFMLSQYAVKIKHSIKNCENFLKTALFYLCLYGFLEIISNYK